jgi:hypothetical protein
MTDSSLSVNDSLVLWLVVPVIVAILRNAFSREIEYWTGAFLAYNRRPFDLDRNPKTHDWCQLFNPASGEWSTVSLTYKFTPFRGSNGVYVHYYDESSDWVLLRTERVPFSDWSSRCKARLNPASLPRGLPLKRSAV